MTTIMSLVVAFLVVVVVGSTGGWWLVGGLVRRLLRMYGVVPRRRRVFTTKKKKTLTWGVLGAARIAPTALVYPAAYSAGRAFVLRVASRNRNNDDKDTAHEFATTYGVPRYSSGDYADVLRDVDVRAVYVPLPNGLHVHWANEALRAGKHVLVEKPLATTAAEAAALVELAARERRCLMEGMHSLFHPSMQRARAIVRSGAIGDVRRVVARFHSCITSPDDIRYNVRGTAPHLAGGALRDNGIYCVYAGMFLADAVVDRVRWVKREMAYGVDARTTAELVLSTGASLRVECAINERAWWRLVPRCTVHGSRGSLYILNFVLPHVVHALVVVTSSFPRIHLRVEQRYMEPNDDVARTSWEHQLRAFCDAVDDVETKTRRGRNMTTGHARTFLGLPCDDPRHAARALDLISTTHAI